MFAITTDSLKASLSEDRIFLFDIIGDSLKTVFAKTRFYCGYLDKIKQKFVNKNLCIDKLMDES